MRALTAILALAMCGPVWADDAAELIKKLDAETFREREEAAQKLEALGKEAIPALASAANEGPLETGIRSIDILKKLMEGDDKETAALAKSALEKLAQSENAATSRRAKNALAPRPDPLPPAIPNRIQIGGGFPVPINGARRISMKTVNGVKTVEVDEGNRKVTIHEDPTKGIQVEITETINGKETTEKFEAKSEDDLKKNHPKAHAEYAKYGKGNVAGIQINVGPNRFGRPMPAFPAPPGFPGIRPANDARLRSIGSLLQSLGRHVERMADDNLIQGASNESRESVKKEIVELKTRLAELEKKLQSAIDEENKKEVPKEPDIKEQRKDAQP